VKNRKFFPQAPRMGLRRREGHRQSLRGSHHMHD
jgi:hypothetical protein